MLQRVVATSMFIVAASSASVSEAAGQPTAAQEIRYRPIEAQGRVAIPGIADSAWYEVYVPVPKPQAVMVFINRDLDQYAYDDRDWRSMCVRARCALFRIGYPRRDGAPSTQQPTRNAASGSGDALIAALREAAARTGMPELATAGLVFFGFSAAGNFGLIFAALHPERTIGAIHYHSNMRGIAVDTARIARIPTLSISGEKDDIAGTADADSLWRAMRARNGPWAWIAQVQQPHWSIDGLVDAGFVMRNWTEEMIARSANPRTRDVATRNGWIVSADAVSAAPQEQWSGSPSAANSWLPTGNIALGFRQLAGMCRSVGLPLAARVLRDSAIVASEDTQVCRYTTPASKRDLWISVSRMGSDTAAIRQLATTLPADKTFPVTIADGIRGVFLADAPRSCATVGITRLAYIYLVTACGSGFGVTSDSTQLADAARRAAGFP